MPQALPLVNIPGVELMHVGEWPISTGIANFTHADLANAVAAVACPAVRRPVLKLGHTEPDPDEKRERWDGEPAVGYIANMATVESGTTLTGDYTGMPGWMTPDVLASAYPDRSIEGQYDFVCQIGHVHPFVITAVALLGVTPPGIGTLQSLQDVAALYGVAASAPETAPAGGDPVTITVHAAREDAVPNPNPTLVRAGVTTDDVRRKYYDSAGYDMWICEMQLGPELQLIVTNDLTGKLSRVAVMVGDGDGEDAVSFGDPVGVVVRYEDSAVAASAGGPAPVRFASRAESRPDQPELVLTRAQWEQLAAAVPGDPEPAPAPEPQPEPDPAPAPAPEPEQQDPAIPVEPPPTTTEGAGMDPVLIRQALGLSPEATDEEVAAAFAAGTTTPAPEPEPTPEPTPEIETPEPPAPVPTAGTVTIDEATLAELREAAQQGVAARARQLNEDRDRTIAAAIGDGRIPPARRDHWLASWKADPDGTKATLASLAPGLVPLQDAGVPGPAEGSTEQFDDIDRLFSAPVPTRQGA